MLWLNSETIETSFYDLQS